MIATRTGPPPTGTHHDEWTRVTVSTDRSFLVKRTANKAYSYLPERTAVARDGDLRPRVALTLLLARTPAISDASIAPLVTGGSLSLVCTLSADAADVYALEDRLGATCRPLFVRNGSAALRDDGRVYVQSDVLGTDAQFWLGTALAAQQALDVLLAFDGTASRLCVETRIAQVAPLAPTPVPLDALLGGILEGLDRSLYVSMIVPQADGTATPVPERVRAIPQDVSRTRDSGRPLPMVAMGQHAAALPFVMAPSTALRPSAAAMIASGATSEGVRLNPHTQYWLGNDARFQHFHPIPINGGDSGADSADTPTAHLPLVTQLDAPFWADALDPKTAWYAPAFGLVMPAANDDPTSATFSFALTPTGPTLGAGGAQSGLTATVRITVDQHMAPETQQALASAGMVTSQPVALNNLSVALEIPYRQTGSPTPLTQRFPGTVTQSGTRLIVSVSLLDDWVRLAYSALAFPPPDGFPPPRLIVDYAFMAYQWVAGGGFHIIYGGKLEQLALVEKRDELPATVMRPTLVTADRLVVGPRSYLQYRREGTQGSVRGVSLATLALHTPNFGLAVARPPLLPPLLPPRRLLTRSIVHEETVDLQLPCATLGALYVQLGADGTTMTALGCQDSLKLGQTATKAFEEITALRDPTYRVYRSLQQPGRILVAPLSYRVGRYAQSEGDKAFRPMILLYGVLDADPAKNRYALTATLIADISAFQFALLQGALRPYIPAHTAAAIVLPTDPFVGARITYAWTIPAGLEQPEALNVVDTFNVTLSMPMADALLLTTMIDNSGIQGKVTFALPDGTSFDAGLVIDGNIIGPADTGPVTTEVASGAVTLTNRAQQTMNVLDVALVDGSGGTTAMAVNATLAPGARTTTAAAAGATQAIADARMGGQQSIGELDVFVEDVTMTVTFIDQVNFANHQLTALRVRARLKGSENVVEADLPQDNVATATFTLPITTYLSRQTLQYALIETRATGATTTAWHDWDLNTGTVIGITADLL